jgi:hypothetical protein
LEHDQSRLLEAVKSISRGNDRFTSIRDVSFVQILLKNSQIEQLRNLVPARIASSKTVVVTARVTGGKVS